MGSNLAEDNGFLRVIKIRGMTSLGGEVNPLVPCRKILWHVKDPYNVKERFCRQNSCIFLAVSAALLLGVSCYCHRAVEDESGMIRTQTGKHISSN
jgi:hypothetical protein